MADKNKEVVDILGNPISVGSYVAAADSNMLEICRVIKIMPVMIKVKRVKSLSNPYGDFNVYPTRVIKIEGEAASAYILKNAK